MFLPVIRIGVVRTSNVVSVYIIEIVIHVVAGIIRSSCKQICDIRIVRRIISKRNTIVILQYKILDVCTICKSLYFGDL